jgi:hypothetical protein
MIIVASDSSSADQNPAESPLACQQVGEIIWSSRPLYWE